MQKKISQKSNSSQKKKPKQTKNKNKPQNKANDQAGMHAEVKVHQEAKLAAIRACLIHLPPGTLPNSGHHQHETLVPIQKYHHDAPWKYNSLQSNSGELGSVLHITFGLA